MNELTPTSRTMYFVCARQRGLSIAVDNRGCIVDVLLVSIDTRSQDGREHRYTQSLGVMAG